MDVGIAELSESVAKKGRVPEMKFDQETADAVRRYEVLQCLVRSLDFADTLSPEDRKAYHYFERSFWHSEAVLPKKTAKSLTGSPVWKAGDERFVIFVLEAGPPWGLGSMTGHGPPSEIRARLLEMAEGEEPSESVREKIKNNIAPPD